MVINVKDRNDRYYYYETQDEAKEKVDSLNQLYSN